MDDILFFLTLIPLAIVVMYMLYKKTEEIYNRKKYGSLSNYDIFERRVNEIYSRLSKNRYISAVIEELTLKLSVFNNMSYERNRANATCVFLGVVFVLLLLSVFAVIICMPLWYIAFVYIGVGAGAIILMFLFISSVIMNSYIKHMPETLKILNSRFVSQGSIAKAIDVSINDFHKSIKGEMIRIYDALRQNDIERISSVFAYVDRKYSNEHMSLLLELIWMAHFNGGSETIRLQFDEMTRDVIEDIENKQDLSSASKSYVVMSVLFIFALPLVRVYNSATFEGSDGGYYSSREGLLLAALYIVAIMILCGILVYLERSEY